MNTAFNKTLIQLQSGIFLIGVVFTFPLFALSNDPLGGRSAGLANASVSLNDIWSSQNNQAGLAFITKAEASAFYENRYLLKELSNTAITCALPLKTGTFSAIINRFGYSQYNESKYALGYARKLGENFSIGVQIDYVSVFVGDIYGGSGTAVAEAGLYYRPTEKLAIGAHVYNPNGSKISTASGEKIPTIMRFGANYTFSEQVIICSEVSKDQRFNIEVKGGLEYKPLKSIGICLGLSSSDTYFSFGFGFKLNTLRLDIASSLHRVLGFSPQASLTYSFN